MNANENNDIVSTEAKRKMYTQFCQLITILHDYAIGRKLRSENNFSWAITANYYSLMHCGRFICMLGIGKYPRGHGELNNLLADEGRHSCNSTTLHNSINVYVPNSTEKIKKLGKNLQTSKKIRESNSYELFITAHQYGHVVLENVFDECYSKLEHMNLDYIEFCLDLLVAYINQSNLREIYIAFLKNRSERYENPIQSFISESILVHQINRQIMTEIQELINRKLDFQTDMILPHSFFEPIHYTDFSLKASKFNEFKRLVDNL